MRLDWSRSRRRKAKLEKAKRHGSRAKVKKAKGAVKDAC